MKFLTFYRPDLYFAEHLSCAAIFPTPSPPPLSVHLLMMLGGGLVAPGRTLRRHLVVVVRAMGLILLLGHHGSVVGLLLLLLKGIQLLGWQYLLVASTTANSNSCSRPGPGHTFVDPKQMCVFGITCHKLAGYPYFLLIYPFWSMHEEQALCKYVNKNRIETEHCVNIGITYAGK